MAKLLVTSAEATIWGKYANCFLLAAYKISDERLIPIKKLENFLIGDMKQLKQQFRPRLLEQLELIKLEERENVYGLTAAILKGIDGRKNGEAFALNSKDFRHLFDLTSSTFNADATTRSNGGSNKCLSHMHLTLLTRDEVYN
jgi:hypothetical protein